MVDCPRIGRASESRGLVIADLVVGLAGLVEFVVEFVVGKWEPSSGLPVVALWVKLWASVLALHTWEMRTTSLVNP